VVVSSWSRDRASNRFTGSGSLTMSSTIRCTVR
jgi:hypothetical protein